MPRLGRVVTWLFETDSDRQLTAWLFLKCLALIYLAAFASLAVQIGGLVGPDGILPLDPMLEAAREQYGAGAWLRIPTLFWLGSESWVLEGAAWAGCLLALLLLSGSLHRLAAVALFALYLSLTQAGQVFTNFQWDYLLLEAGLLAIFLKDGPSRLLILLYHWLLFRLRFLSGYSKILSEDPSWAQLTTLNHYFETQPLPHIGAWYAHQLPEWLLAFGTGLVLFAELVVPFFIFLPRRFRLFAAALTIMLQLLIMATSNHNFFNLLTIVLCLFLLDDRIVARILPKRLVAPASKSTPAVAIRGIQGVVAGLMLLTSLAFSVMMVTRRELPPPLMDTARIARAFGLGSMYHVFPNMQTERHELIVQGSADGEEWKDYLFRYKPDTSYEMPPLVVPHQPRLDWMMWFVPTQNPAMQEWFGGLLEGLWQNRPAVTELLAVNPFPEQGPSQLRVLAYRFSFSTPEQLRETGRWWQTEYLGEFPYVQPRRP